MKIVKITRLIYYLRGQRIMLDRDLAELYGVETKTLNRAIKRNRERFPADSMFQVSRAEWENFKYQFGTSSRGGDRRALPYAFTEHDRELTEHAAHINEAFAEIRRLSGP